MKRILFGAVGLVVVLAVAALVIPFFLPKDAIKQQIVAQVESATGWRLRLDGAVGLSLLPSFSLSARDVGLSGEAGADGVEFVKVAEIDFGLSLSALVGGTARVTGITLREPQILLETDKSGRTSWAPRRTLSDLIEDSLATEGGSSPDAVLPPAPEGERRVPEGAVAAQEAGSDLADLLRRVRIDDLTIVDGALSFADRRTGQAISIEKINTNLYLPSPEEPANLEGTLVWRDRTFDVEAQVGAPLALAQKKPSEVTAEISGDFGTATVSGTINTAPLSGTLRIAASGESLADAFDAFGVSASPSAGTGAFEIAATTDLAPGQVSIEDLSVKAAGSTVSGRVVADLSQSEPAFEARLGIDTIDLDRFAAKGNGGELGAIETVDLALSVDGLGRPATAKGGFSWNGEHFDLSATAAPGPLMAGKPAPVEASLTGRRLTLGANGTASLSGGYDGRLSLETPNLRNLLAWLGHPLPPGDGLRKLALSGRFSASADRIGVSGASVTLDGTSGKGEGSMALGGAVPKITASLALDRLVLDPYLGGADTGKAGAPGGGSGTRSGAKDKGWSREPIDFSALKAVDADLTLSAETIRWDRLKIGRSKLAVTVAGGRLKADLDPLNLYEGTAHGQVSLDARAKQPTVAASLDLSGLDAHPFLTDLADFRDLHGRAAMSFDVTAAGGNQAALASSLAGKARVAFTSGSLRGINIPKMVRNLSVATLVGWGDKGEAEATDFNELSADFDIRNGVATTSDLTLVGPLVRVSGGGKTDIGRRSIDWRVEPKIVASLEGQGADGDLVGLGVPVIIRGPWDNPKIYPDIAGILENPDQAYKKLQSVSGGLLDIIKKNPGKAVEETVKQLSGEGIDIRKVMEGDVDDDAVVKSIEKGFKIAPDLFGLGKRKDKE